MCSTDLFGGVRGGWAFKVKGFCNCDSLSVGCLAIFLPFVHASNSPLIFSPAVWDITQQPVALKKKKGADKIRNVFRQNKPLISSKKKKKTLFGNLIKFFQNTYIFKCINKAIKGGFTTFTITLFTQRGTYRFCALKKRPTPVNILHHVGFCFSRCCINDGLIRFMWM